MNGGYLIRHRTTPNNDATTHGWGVARLYALLPADALAIAHEVVRAGRPANPSLPLAAADPLDYRDPLDEFETVVIDDADAPPSYVRAVFYREPSPALANLQMEWPEPADPQRDAWIDMLRVADTGQWLIHASVANLPSEPQTVTHLAGSAYAPLLTRVAELLETSVDIPSSHLAAFRAFAG